MAWWTNRIGNKGDMLENDVAVEGQVALLRSQQVHSGCFLTLQPTLQKSLNFLHKDQPVNILCLEVISVF